jgi:IS605 OrfB family transposase
MLDCRRIELPFEDKSTGQRAALLSDALEEVIDWALAAKKPVVIEDLDFGAKKKRLGQMSAAQARALSGLAYAKYLQLIASKCYRRGVALIKINPAFTSVAGRLKYAQPLGLSVHQAAAGVIARRGQGFIEKLPRRSSIRIHAHGTTSDFPPPARKSGASRGVAWQRLSTALRAFLRKKYLATRSPAQQVFVVRSVSGKTSKRSVAPGGPSGGTVPSAGTNFAHRPDGQ